MTKEGINKEPFKIDRISRELWQSYTETSKPAIFVDALSNWHVDERWSPESLARAVGHKRVTVSFAKNGGFFFNRSVSSDWKKACDFDMVDMDFADAIRAIFSANAGEQIYVLQQSLKDRLPELLENLSVPDFVQLSKADINLFVGRDTRGALHHDCSDNFFAQVYGTKKFIIFSPEDSAYLYPYPSDAHMLHFSYVNANDPDFTRYPKYALTSPIVFELRAGDLLFLPAYWWHQVDGNGISVSVNTWISGRFSQIIDAPNSVRGLLAAYRDDRLAKFKDECLSAAHLDLTSAANLLLARGKTCGAGVLALAAFDDLTAELHQHGRSQGCTLKELSEELGHVCDIIRAQPSISQEVKAALEPIPQLACAASECDDAKIASSEVTSLLEAIGELNKTGICQSG